MIFQSYSSIFIKIESVVSQLEWEMWIFPWIILMISFLWGCYELKKKKEDI